MPGLTRRELLLRAAYVAPAAFLPGLLAACGNDSGSGSGGSQALDVLVGFGTGNAPNQIPAQEELARAFASGGGPGISFRRIPDGDEAQRQLGVLIAAGTPPDIILPTGVFGISLYLDEDLAGPGTARTRRRCRSRSVRRGRNRLGKGAQLLRARLRRHRRPAGGGLHPHRRLQQGSVRRGRCQRASAQVGCVGLGLQRPARDDQGAHPRFERAYGSRLRLQPR